MNNRNGDALRKGRSRPFVLLSAILAPPVLAFLGVVPPYALLVSVVLVVLILLRMVASHAATLLFVFVTVATVLTIHQQPWLNVAPADVEASGGIDLADAWKHRGGFDESLPIVIHIVLDELMSQGAIDPSLPGGAATRDAFRAFAARHRLRLFDSIYSRYFWSEGALMTILNPSNLDWTLPANLAPADGRGLATNEHFEHMVSKGYDIAVFQSAVLDFCGPSDVSVCETFRSFDPGMASESRLDDRTRTVHLWDAFFRAYEPSYTSSAGRWLLRELYGLDQRELGELGAADRFDVQGFVPWFDRYAAFVSHVPRGSYVFSHFLAPHGPYLLSESCVVAGSYDVGYFMNGRYANAEERTAERRRYYESYFSQARCVISKLDEFLQAIDAMPQFADATIVIHGDHGSRISAGYKLEEYQHQDFIDNYGTFFAVRKSGLDPGIDCTFTSLPQMLRVVMRSDALGTTAPLPLIVGSTGGDGVLVEAAMPMFGCAAEPPE